jgi:hypothetical protein
MEWAKKLRKYYFLGIGISMLLSQPLIGAATETSKGSTMSSAQIDETGKRLAAAMQSRYAELKSAGSLKWSGQGRNFVPGLVQSYVPAGTSLVTAEAILTAAGCKVSKFPGAGPQTVNEFEKNISGVLVVEQHIGRSAKFVITLKPSEDFVTVKETTGEVILTAI